MNPPMVILAGELDIREQARQTLHEIEGIEIVGEIAVLESRHLSFSEQMAPEIDVLDCAALGLDSQRSLRHLRQSKIRVIVIEPDESTTKSMLLDFGASGVVSTRKELHAAIAHEVVHLDNTSHYHQAA